MSKYKEFRVTEVQDYSLLDRKSKVSIQDFAKPLRSDSFSEWVKNLPKILAGRELRELAEAIRKAADGKRARIWGFGGHVVKVGLAPVLIDLMDRGFVSAMATSGSGLIHDFEVGFCGKTSEDVDSEIRSGAFGMARETGTLLNDFISRGVEAGEGIGEAVAKRMDAANLEYAASSLFLQAYQREIPITVHMAFGTDIIHNHPAASGEAVGKGSQIDFDIFTEIVSKLNDGGAYLNLGSAVVLPEVFLKAVARVRNAGCELQSFVTANFDFIQHYRPTQNVIKRPVQESGRGFAFTGHHELMIPLLAACLIYGELR